MTEPEKNPQEAKIKHGLPPKRNPVSYQTTRDIIIPAGTILRCVNEKFVCAIGAEAAGFHAEIVVSVDDGALASNVFKKVMAA